MHIHGIIPPVATPLQANEDLDLPRALVRGLGGAFRVLDGAANAESAVQRSPVLAQ